MLTKYEWQIISLVSNQWSQKPILDERMIFGAGCTEHYEDFYMGSVHVKDVALAHILLYENPSASGRHLCVESIIHFSDFASKVAELYPEYNVPKYEPSLCFHISAFFLKKLMKFFSFISPYFLHFRFPKDTQPGLLRSQNPSKKLMDLGLRLIPIEQIIKDAVESLKSKGYISWKLLLLYAILVSSAFMKGSLNLVKDSLNLVNMEKLYPGGTFRVSEMTLWIFSYFITILECIIPACFWTEPVLFFSFDWLEHERVLFFHLHYFLEYREVATFVAFNPVLAICMNRKAVCFLQQASSRVHMYM